MRPAAIRASSSPPTPAKRTSISPAFCASAFTCFTLGTARTLFSFGDAGLEPSLDVAADGRFLVVRERSEDPHRGLLLVENWLEEFSKP